MATDSKQLAENAEAMMVGEMKRKRPPTPQAPAWQPMTGIRSDGGDAARKALRRGK